MFSIKKCQITETIYKNKNTIDMNAVLKTFQTISSEIELDKLVEKLLENAIEHLHAHKAFFIMESKGTLIIEGEMSNHHLSVMQGIPLASCQNIAHSIINYVARTRENIILDDAFHEELFATDPYIVKNKSKSILCLPIIYGGNLKGIVYLENNLITSAFPRKHFDFFKLLASQTAISIENASMYKEIKELNCDLEKKVEKRTEELNKTIQKLQSEIYERKKVEKDLEENKERLYTLINALPTIICFKDGEGKWLEVNEACGKLFGFEGKDYKGLNDLELAENSLCKNTFLNCRETDEKTWRKGTITRGEEEFLCHDGTKKLMDVIKVPIFHPNGKRKAMVVACSDITKRKRSELALKESEERYRLLVELLPDAVLIHRNHKIVLANEAGVKMFGAKKNEELIGKSMKNFVHPNCYEIFNKRMNLVQNEGKIAPLSEQKYIKIDGTMMNIEIASNAFPHKGNMSVLSVIRDITERKQAEKLRKYDRLKTEFFANISHEFKTPLNVLLGALQMLNLMLKNPSIDMNMNKISKYSNMMTQNAYRLIRLVNNLIDITKIDAGYFQIHLKNHNIVSIVEGITLSVAEYIQDKGIELTFDTDIEEKIVACDDDKMERIILNLLSNSIKFTEPGGRIFVNMIDQGESIIISIKDTGIGIPKEKQHLIFERFIQVDKSLSRNKEGSGIGLSLVQSLIEMHSGKISIASEYGLGSEFIIEIPAVILQDEMIETRNYHSENDNIERINIEFSDIYF
ncbi:PAS domain S-box protein [Lutibacter sp. B2]|nr:PAS domain S-box protein [Lutibacter sp. B2]